MKSKNLRTIEQIMSDHGPVPFNGIEPGDYVFATKFSDANPNDRWFVGFVSEVVRGIRPHVLINKTGVIPYRYAQKITQEEGAFLIMYYGMCENKKSISE